MDDRELLELAAKAEGLDIDPIDAMHEPDDWMCWNPLTDDGDALRLAVKLRLDVMFFEGFQEVHSAHCTVDFSATGEPYGDDAGAATRRAIVRAAAEIGRAM